jgi:hypothetical protein
MGRSAIQLVSLKTLPMQGKLQQLQQLQHRTNFVDFAAIGRNDSTAPREVDRGKTEYTVFKVHDFRVAWF